VERSVVLGRSCKGRRMLLSDCSYFQEWGFSFCDENERRSFGELLMRTDRRNRVHKSRNKDEYSKKKATS